MKRNSVTHMLGGKKATETAFEGVPVSGVGKMSSAAEKDKTSRSQKPRIQNHSQTVLF